ncbi:DNA polymerase [Trabala vishnou gigantina nucleopolyhedrovirus]|uniref:DNA polymerase n=1 Tax=Trabala vishnou gigantina nucleopolyhedrovirus TaxID=2863583 RepID=UPI002481B5FA|nr:DNA polymerase [Trabala vishnou gigantina nucleopolyhedrovirus]QYC92650.1 DNA polymerase [Trabala vishnou gigantina nucleopolyhedrovirus]
MTSNGGARTVIIEGGGDNGNSNNVNSNNVNGNNNNNNNNNSDSNDAAGLINLMKWEHVEMALKNRFKNTTSVSINVNDVFRIVKMAYRNNKLLIFLTGHLQNHGNVLYQFYVESKHDLYSYKFCYNNHAHTSCRNNCKSYKTFVMPGLNTVHMDKFNVIKYKCESKTCSDIYGYKQKTIGYKPKAIDYFLRDVNRIHMQTKFKEGEYVKFTSAQQCVDNCLRCLDCDEKSLDAMLDVVPVDALKREIIPVIVSYDIETHSNGLRFSNAAENHIMSISMVERRDGSDTKLCLYYINNDKNDDLHDTVFSTNNYTTTCDNGVVDNNINNNFCAFNGREIVAVRFDSELKMLQAFFKLLPLFNADYLLDYNGDKFDLPFILDRIKLLTKNARLSLSKSTKRSKTNDRVVDYGDVTKICRYNLEPVDIETQTVHDKFTNKIDNHLFTYYVHVDLYQFLSSDPEHNNLENYQLNTVAEHYLNANKVDLSVAQMLALYNDNKIKKIIEYNVQDSVLPINVFLKLKIMDFMYTQCMLLHLCTDDILANISHKISVIFFYLCLNNTTIAKNNTSIPDPYIFNKNDLNITSGRSKSSYVSRAVACSAATVDDEDDAAAVAKTAVSAKQTVDLSLLNRTPIPVDKIPLDAIKLCTLRPKCNFRGGKVMLVKNGKMKYVASLDFSSLYLTIMKEEGICFSNLFIGADGFVYLIKNTKAINPNLLKNLLDLRNVYKNMRDSYTVGTFLYNLYDQIQNAIKRIANSIFGYFGIYFVALANYITKIGRSKLTEAVKKIEAMSDDCVIKNAFNLSKIQFKVVYGDTDSSFIQIDFEENEIAPENRFGTIKTIVNDHVLKTLNDSWLDQGKGYSMAFENLMYNLIVLKKKKYCYINSENRIKYKGWLVKKDMPMFMRKTFRAVVDYYLKDHSVACGLRLLHRLMTEHYNAFGRDNNLTDYSFSMSYNEMSTSKKRTSDAAAAAAKDNNGCEIKNGGVRKPVITIAKHCREILKQSGVKDLPGIGDRIPYLLVDIKGKITQKSYPLALFNLNDATIRISWLKHINILCNFMNELMQMFGNGPEFEYYFSTICSLYMSNQRHDIKYPVLVACKKNKIVGKKSGVAQKQSVDDNEIEIDLDTDSEREGDEVKLNYTHQFNMHSRPLKNKKKHLSPPLILCKKCQEIKSEQK